MLDSFVQFWADFVSKVQGSVSTFGPRAVLVVFVFGLFFLIAQLFKLYSQRTFDVNLYKRPTPEAIAKYNRDRRKVFYGRFLWLVFLILAWSLALSTSGVHVTALFEGLGFLGLGLAFALSDLIQQYIAGFLILSQKHFNIGEQIKVLDTTGVIKAIESRYTIVRDFKENDVMVPNTEILKNAVTIAQVQHSLRDVIHVRVANDTDVRRAISLGEQSITATRGVDATVPPKGYLRYFGDSMQLAFYYTGPAVRREQFVVRSEVLLNLNDAYHKNSIVISYPNGIDVEEIEAD